MIILASYPRSGNTWVRYCIEHLTNRSTIGYRGNDMFVKDRNPIVRKTHLLNGEKIPQTADGVIFLTRDPFYVIPRHTESKRYEIFVSNLTRYCNMIKQYDNLSNTVKTKCFKYEWIISNPEDFLNELGDYFNIKQKVVDDFITHLDEHQQKSIQFYQDNYGTPKTRNNLTGPVERFHVKEGTKLLKEKYPQITEKYLTEYLNEI